MPPVIQQAPLIAIAGNPNVGKTSIFNRLTGLDLKVTNYPGVTVERQEGHFHLRDGSRATVIDIPGTYSMSGRSAEEQIAIAAIAGLPPNVSPNLLVMVIDATQLSRNLYLLLQALELHVPTVVALTMTDTLSAHGQKLDVNRLEIALGVPVVPVVGHKGQGMDELRDRICTALENPETAKPGWRWRPEDPALLEDIDQVSGHVPDDWAHGNQDRKWALAIWALLSLDDEDELIGIPDSLRRCVGERRAAAEAEGREIEPEVIGGRYAWIDQHAAPALQSAHEYRTRTERIDALLLHPVFGFALFILAMGIVFQSLFSWADPAIGLVETVFASISAGVESVMPESLFRDFLTEGVIAGVGSVLVFLPQILLLFFLIGLMEDTGYMARVAFLMDRLMRRLGLHGRAFVPMLSGYACAVPAIMATRTMERRRDRMVTMMSLPLMSCSARLPVYTLLIAALFPPQKILGFPVQGLLMVGMYLFSTVIALLAAGILGRTVFKGVRVPLLLELPSYRRPHLGSVLRMMWQRASLFVREAGQVIMVCTIGLWILLSFPKNPTLDVDYDALRAEVPAGQTERLAELDTRENNDVFLHSYGARLGHAIEPVIEPLGFDWKIGIGLIGAFAAREVFISTLGVVYGVSEEADENSPTLREHLRNETRPDGSRLYTPLVGLSLMVFIALSCQCMSTLAAVYRETGGLRWPAFMFTYMTALAWIASVVIYQGGRMLGFA
jgi:ferrous iron transport protein B